MWVAEDHTADVLLRVEAEGWTELLGEAAAAFGAWVCDGAAPDVPRPVVRALEVRGADAPETWVRWWRGLHRLWVVEGCLPLGADVEPTGDVCRASGRVRCAPADAVDPASCAEAKAVTWHGAEAGPLEGGGWRGRIVLDI